MRRALWTMAEQWRTMGFCLSLDHRGRRICFIAKGSERGHLTWLKPIFRGGASKYLVKLLYFVAIFCLFDERIEHFPRDLWLAALAVRRWLIFALELTGCVVRADTFHCLILSMQPRTIALVEGAVAITWYSLQRWMLAFLQVSVLFMLQLTKALLLFYWEKLASLPSALGHWIGIFF